MTPKAPNGRERFLAWDAETRARIFRLLRFSVLFWACVYFALVAVSGHTYFRSLAFGLAAAFALWLVAGSLFSDNEPMPVPPASLLLAIAAWAAWCAASLAWSLHPAYSRAELGTEVGWGLATAAIFYVATRGAYAFRALVTTAVAVAAFLALTAVHAVLTTQGFDPDVVLVHQHGGVGAFSTLIVLVVPLLPLLVAPRPLGYGTGWLPLLFAFAVFLLLLIGARITENRMVWVALGAGFVLAAALAAWRWRHRLRRAPWRWMAVLVALLLVVGALFLDAAIQRSHEGFRPKESVAQALAEDPRLLLWQHTFERIAERPWLGFGYGKSILREELQGELGDPMLAHAHNLFVSQWLQTGAIGTLLLCAMLAAIAACYVRFLRAPDGTLAAIGLVGLVMLATFVVKNLTDDFLIRPTSKEFWALNALLVAIGLRMQLQWPGAVAIARPGRSA
ncbi:MAG: O-antigen ligase family protein [Burkholderiales bacterium]